MRALYISHNGMLENLGQAQVLPYVRGLARLGVSFDLVSYELPSASTNDIEALRASLGAHGIRWLPLRRSPNHSLSTKIAESVRGVARALELAIARRPEIIHGRSYLPTAVADLVASTVPRARLLFDCRGMLGDEYVDAGYWTTGRPEYKLLKRYERRAFQRAEGVVVLTERLREIALSSGWVGPRTTIEAIPCCVDTDRFRHDGGARTRIRAELGWDDRLVVVYSGSLGGWYMEEELARFVAMLKRSIAHRRLGFLVLTHHPTTALEAFLRRHGVDDKEVAVRKVAPSNMAQFLSAADLGLSFIKSCFSKLGSSPTKVAEYLACGLPVVLNGDIGDQQALDREPAACVVVDSLATAALARAVDPAVRLAEKDLARRVADAAAVAERHFGLHTVGVARYARLYRTMVAAPRTQS